MIKETYKERMIIRTNWYNHQTIERDFVAIVHLCQEKIGFVYNKNRNSWEFPGGKIEETDLSLIDSARREYHEETKMNAPENLSYCFTVKNIPIKNPKLHSFCHFFTCETKIEPSSNINNQFVFYKEIPIETSFDSNTYKIIIDEIYSLVPISLKKNSNAWDKISDQYLSKTKFSFKDIHFGPCIPGNSKLQLIKNIEGKRVLDLGCGLGHNSIALSRLGTKVCAVDFSKKQLSRAVALAKELKQNIDFCHSDFQMGITHAGKDVSLILSVFSLQFSNDIRKLFKNIYDALASGGLFIFSLPHPVGILLKGQGVKIVEKNWGNGVSMLTRYYSVEYLLSVLKESGFSQCHMFEPLHDVDNSTYPYSSEYDTQRLSCRSVPYTLIISAKKLN